MMTESEKRLETATRLLRELDGCFSGFISEPGKGIVYISVKSPETLRETQEKVWDFLEVES